MKQSTVLFVILAGIQTLYWSCSSSVSGIETTNGHVVLCLVKQNGSAASGVGVLGIPVQYDPVRDSSIIPLSAARTDQAGICTLSVDREGAYNVLSTDTNTLLRSFCAVTAVQKGKTVFITDTLRQTGAARVSLPAIADTLTDYVYIPGTNRYQKLSDEKILHEGNQVCIIFDTIPAAKMPLLLLRKPDPLFNPLPIADAFTVVSGDTIDTDVHMQWKVFNQSNSAIPSNDVRCIFTDRTDRLWCGTAMSGVGLYDGTQWTTYTSKNSPLPDDRINGLCQDTSGALWISTMNGVAVLRDTGWQVFTPSNGSIPTAMVYGGAIDNAGHVWFGTFEGCLEYRGTEWVKHSASTEVVMDFVNCIAIDNEGTVLAGGRFGLFSYAQQSPGNPQWKYVSFNLSKFAGTQINDIKVGPDNGYVVSTPLGIVACKNGVWQEPLADISPQLQINNQCVAIAAGGVIWSGTNSSGNLVCYSCPVVVYNSMNTEALNNVITFNALAFCGSTILYCATESNGIVQIQWLRK
ncbi:MAG: hypothetical protein JW795_24075 [Chitinivibrionales bacterium]|nr:hypothetical protein [Chitinivibrionales bacterium]